MTDRLFLFEHPPKSRPVDYCRQTGSAIELELNSYNLPLNIKSTDEGAARPSSIRLPRENINAMRISPEQRLAHEILRIRYEVDEITAWKQGVRSYIRWPFLGLKCSRYGYYRATPGSGRAYYHEDWR